MITAGPSAILRIPNNTYGVIARNAANDADVNVVKINASNRVEFGATLEKVVSVWVPVTVAVGGSLTTYSDYAGVLLTNAANNTGYASSVIPTGFASLTKAVAVLIPKATGNLRWAIYTDYAASGEAYTTNSESVGPDVTAVTADQMIDISIISALSAVAAGDRVGFNFNRTADNIADTSEGDALLLGFLLEYRI